MSESVEIVIDSRVIMVGHEAYQLRQVSRVSTYTKTPQPSYGKYIAAMVFGGLLLISGVSGNSAGLALIGLAIGAAGVWRMIAARSVRPLYVLLIESAGVVRGVVGSYQQFAITEARDTILQAMRNPPDAPVHIRIGDAVWGDKITQVGDGNIGKVGSR